jgi:hypothetical protein
VQKKPRKKQLPKEVIDHWPEVLKDVHIDVVPLEYLNSVRVEFTDGKIWDIDINTDKKPVKDLEKSLDDLFEQYQNVIKNVDFRLDTDKVKADITKRTKKFLKLRR